MSWAPRRSARSAKRSASIARRNNPAFFRELPDLDMHIVKYGALFGYLLLRAVEAIRGRFTPSRLTEFVEDVAMVGVNSVARDASLAGKSGNRQSMG